MCDTGTTCYPTLSQEKRGYAVPVLHLHVVYLGEASHVQVHHDQGGVVWKRKTITNGKVAWGHRRFDLTNTSSPTQLTHAWWCHPSLVLSDILSGLTQWSHSCLSNTVCISTGSTQVLSQRLMIPPHVQVHCCKSKTVFRLWMETARLKVLISWM